MVAPVKQLIEQAMQLGLEDRRRLAEVLWESLGDERWEEGFATPEIAAAWKEEVERRVAAYDRGEAKAVPMEEALAWIRQRLDERRRNA